jgi:aldehyde dehydrogenase (NAD+)
MDAVSITSAAPIRFPDRFFIGGEWVRPSSEAVIEVISPTTEELYLRVAEAQKADVAAAVSAARHAFDEGPWPRMTHVERAGYIRAIAREVAARAKDFAFAAPNEVGVLHTHATAGAQRLRGVYEYYAGLADIFPFYERHVPGPSAGGGRGLLVREPVGVVATIIPWNAPSMVTAYKLAPALLAGCTVIVKSSPEAPSAGYILAEAIEAAKLPPGVVNFITADREASEALVRDLRVDKISFTGSSAVGKRIAAICSERVGRYTLELGGKSAAVILDDYDMATAAESLSQAARVLTGQVCFSVSRVIVDRARHDDFVEALSAAFRKIRIGNPFAAGTDMGPLAMRRQRDRVEHYIAKGREEGATLATGGGRPKGLERGFFIEPTVFGNVDNHSTIGREEIFGPVISVIAADSEAHAIELANDTIYGLNASVFTHDARRAYQVSRQLRSGTVGQNGVRVDAAIAFGGFKQSGVGREGGTEGLLPYLETKTVLPDEDPGALGTN